MDKLRIEIEPQILCKCGKSIVPMTKTERDEYDAAVRQIEERRSQTAPEPTGDEENFVERRDK